MGGGEVCKGFWWGNLRERDYLGDLGVDGWIILTFWSRNYFFNFNTSCTLNVNNTGTKQVRIMKQTAF
jgi:hypothetical protein